MDFSWAWVGWILAFLVIEGLALFNKDKGDTLSENVWRWFGVKGKPSGKNSLRTMGLMGFMIWLAIHFVSGGRI